MLNRKTVLGLDLFVTGTVATAQIVWATKLAPTLGLSPRVLLVSGAICEVFCVYLAYLVLAPQITGSSVRRVVTINLLWAVDGVILFLIKEKEMTGLGKSFVLLQVGIVVLFALLQALSLQSGKTGEVQS